jgi:hypothetical protein
MVSVQNLHRPALWGFFLACASLLSAAVTNLSVDRPYHVFPLCHPSMDVYMHTEVNLRRYLVRLDGLSLRHRLLSLLLWHTGPEVCPVHAAADGTRGATRPGGGDGVTVSHVRGSARHHQREHLRPAAHRLVHGDKSGAATGGAGGQNHRPSRPALRGLWLRCAGLDHAVGRDCLPR